MPFVVVSSATDENEEKNDKILKQVFKN